MACSPYEIPGESGKKLSRCGRRSRKRRRHTVKDQPVVCDQEREMVELRQWMKKISGFRCSLIPATFRDTGRGLMTKKPISCGDTIISLPKSLLITTETVLTSEAGEHVKNWVPKLTQQEAISVFVIWENSKATVSAWKPYLSTLPKTFTTPGYFIDTELSLLPASVYKKCISEINKIRLSYDKVSKYSRNRWTDFHLILSYEVFMWAWYAINSRSVYYKQTRCEFLSDSEEDHLALAPFLDLLNHSATANVSAGFNKFTECYEIQTFNNYGKYNQVFISYGQHDSLKLFMEYGFCVPDNPNDVFNFSYDDLLDICKEFRVQYVEKKLQILRENKLLDSLTCSMEGISWNLWTNLKTLSMSWNQLQTWSDICILEHDDASLVSTATSMAKFLIKRALMQNQQGVKRIQEMTENGADLNPDHVRLARTLTDIEQDILKQSLGLLG